MCELTIICGSDRRTLPAAPGALVSDLLRQAVPSFALPCAGLFHCPQTCRERPSRSRLDGRFFVLSSRHFYSKES